MPNNVDLINEAIGSLAERSSVFSATDVVAVADLAGRDDTVVDALRAQCDDGAVLPLDEETDTDPWSRRYLGKGPVERWWVESSVCWGQAGLGWMSPAGLAGEMASAFDDRPWDDVPVALLNVGREWAAVADGYQSDTFIFPWATVIHGDSQFADGLRSLYDSGRFDCKAIIDEVLLGLSEREADVLRRRTGFGTGQRETLVSIGSIYGVSRERIRQVEEIAWGKFAFQSLRQGMLHAFAIDFVRTGGSLLVSEHGITPMRKALYRGCGLNAAHIYEFGLYFLGAESVIESYMSFLRGADSYLDDATVGQQDCETMSLLWLLSESDGAALISAEEDYWYRQGAKTRPRMLRDALRSLRRAAHFEEIAEECYRLFPECNASVESLHAALSMASAPNKERFGIVRVGLQGMYGLKEHGYGGPDAELSDAVATIVETIFGRIDRPVSQEAVITELSRQGRELYSNSVIMALALNDRLESAGLGEYAPKGSGWGIAPGEGRS